MELCQGLLVVLLQYVLQKVDILIVLYAETDRVYLPSLKMFGFQLNFNQIFVIEQPIIFFKYYISILGRGGLDAHWAWEMGQVSLKFQILNC